MKNTTSALAALLLAGLTASSPLPAVEQNSANTLKLGDARPPAATLADVAWLTGYWRGEGFGGQVEEAWSEPLAGSMMGMFRFVKDGQVAFYEILALVEDEGSLTMKVKHFTGDFVAWEEKEDAVRFRLVRIGEREAFFEGLTVRRNDDETLDVFIVLKNKSGETKEERLSFRRVVPRTP